MREPRFKVGERVRLTVTDPTCAWVKHGYKFGTITRIDRSCCYAGPGQNWEDEVVDPVGYGVRWEEYKGYGSLTNCHTADESILAPDFDPVSDDEIRQVFGIS